MSIRKNHIITILTETRLKVSSLNSQQNESKKKNKYRTHMCIHNDNQIIDVYHAQTTNVAGIPKLFFLQNNIYFMSDTDNGSQCYIPFVSDACINNEHSFFFISKYFNWLVWLFDSFSSFTFFSYSKSTDWNCLILRWAKRKWIGFIYDLLCAVCVCVWNCGRFTGLLFNRHGPHSVHGAIVYNYISFNIALLLRSLGTNEFQWMMKGWNAININNDTK